VHTDNHRLIAVYHMNVKNSMNLLIIDDHAMFADGLRHIFSAQSDAAHIDASTSLSESVEYFDNDVHYDVIILDLNFPDVDGLDLLRICLRKRPDTPVLIVSAEVNPARIFAAKRIGALGFVAKSNSSDSILTAVRRVQSGKEYYEQSLKSVFKLLPKNAVQTKSPLSRRQHEVLTLIGKGYDNQTIAEMLFISVSTVKTHINAIFNILDVSSRSECIKKAQDHEML